MSGITERAFLSAEADKLPGEGVSSSRISERLDPIVLKREKEVLLKDLGIKEPNTIVTLEQITDTLKRHKHKRPFDNDLVVEVFEVSAKPTNTTQSRREVTWSTFIETYLYARHEVALSLWQASDLLRTTNRNLVHCQDQLRLLTGSSSVQDDPDQIQNRLVVQIVSGRFDNYGVGDFLKLHLDCWNQAIETQPQRIQSDGQVLWNEVFAFTPSKNPEGMFRARVFKAAEADVLMLNTSASLPDEIWELCGVIEVPASTFRDQVKHVMERPVLDGLPGELTFSAQWIFDRILFYETSLRSLGSDKLRFERELAEKQAMMSKFDLPFGGFQMTQESTVSKMVLEGLKHPSAVFSQAIGIALDSMKATNYQKASQVVVGVFICLSLLGCFARAMFLDMLIGGYTFWCNLDVQRWTPKRYLSVIWFCVYSLVLDGVWNAVNFRIWASGSSEAELYLIAKVFSLLTVLWKVLIILFCWKCRYDLVHYGYLPTDLTKVH